MACKLAVDMRPLEMAELLSYVPAGPVPPSSYRSNLKVLRECEVIPRAHGARPTFRPRGQVWRFFAPSASPHVVQSAAVGPDALGRFDASESYVLLHIYRRRDPLADGQAAAAAPSANDGAANGGDARAAGRTAAGSLNLAELAETSRQMLTPRGLAAAFSGAQPAQPANQASNVRVAAWRLRSCGRGWGVAGRLRGAAARLHRSAQTRHLVRLRLRRLRAVPV